MTRLTDYVSYADAQAHCSNDKLWELFDGDRERMNIAHECIDRHVDGERDGGHPGPRERPGRDRSASAAFREESARFAHHLVEHGVKPGDRVAVMLEPSLEFYVAMFGAMKMGAIAVPLFTLFGPDGIRLRVQDCQPRILVTNAEKAPMVDRTPGLQIVIADTGFVDSLGIHPSEFTPQTRGDDLAIFQYTSGTTRELPDAVKHTHRSIVTLMMAALYGTGRAARRPVHVPVVASLGARPVARHPGAAGAGRDDRRLCRQVQCGALAAGLAGASLQQHLGCRDALPDDAQLRRSAKLSATASTRCPSPASRSTAKPPQFVEATFGRPACSMYGTTEIGVCLVNYPGAPDFIVKPGSLGKPIPGVQVEVQDANGGACAPGVTGELKLWRRGAWLATKDLGRVDEDGYFWHGGRADDVIISAGWTIERGRDRGRHPEAPRCHRSRRHRRSRCLARAGREGIRGRRVATATRHSSTRSRRPFGSA